MTKNLFDTITKNFSFNKLNTKRRVNHLDEQLTQLNDARDIKNIKEDIKQNTQPLKYKKSTHSQYFSKIPLDEIEKTNDIEEYKNSNNNNNNNVQEHNTINPQTTKMPKYITNVIKEEETAVISQSFIGYEEIKKAITTRRSVRQFTTHPVPYKIIYDIISTATHCPKAGNIQSFHTTIVQDTSKIATLANLSYQQSWIAQAPLILVISSTTGELSKLYPDMYSRFATQTTTSFISSILLLIHLAGLSSCWVESFQEEVIKDFLNIPKDDEIHALLPIGFANEIPKPPITGDLLMSISYNEFGNKENI